MSRSAPLLLLACVVIAVAVIAALGARRIRRRRSLARSLHELRGGLAALELGLTAMERTDSARAELIDWVEALRAPLERAKLGARDLDAFRRGEALPVAEFGEELVDLTAVVSACVRSWSRLAWSHGARLELDWRAGSVKVRGEGARLRQALDNLIANALQHGEGPVTVAGELRRGRLRLAISDQGRGWQSKKIREASPSSVNGHGLAIANDVIEAHRGTLRAGAGRHRNAVVVELPAVCSAIAGVASRRVGAPAPAESSGIGPAPKAA